MDKNIKKLLQASQNWWLIWAIASVVLFSLGFTLAVSLDPYFLLLEYIAAAVFGLWAYDKSGFSTSLLKFLFLFVAMSGMIFVFAMSYVWVSILIVLALMWLLKFSKEQFIWSFGVMLLYGLLGFIPLLCFVLMAPVDVENYHEWEILIGKFLLVILAGYFAKGAFFGAIMAWFYERKRKVMNIEDFFKNSSDEQIQEFLRNIDMDRFAPLLEEYPPFVKQRVLENVTDRVAIWIEEKIKQARQKPMDADAKEEFIKDMDEFIKKR